MNPHEGSVPLVHAGRTLPVCFNLRAIAAVQSAYGLETHMDRVAHILKYRDAEGLAFLVSISTPPGETADKILDWSPPLVPMAEAVQVAILLGMHGPKMTPEEALGKRGPRMAHAITWLKQSLQRFMPASRGPNSGPSRPTPSA